MSYFVVVSLVTTILGPSSNPSQTSQTQSAPQPIVCSPIVSTPAPGDAKPDALPSELLPGSFARGLRSLQVAYEITDNNDFVVAKVPDADGSLIETLVRNPDQKLWKTTFTLRPGEWLTSPSELEKAYGSLAEFQKIYGGTLQSPGTLKELQALAEGRAWGVGSALLNSVTGSVAWSRRPTASNLDPAFMDVDDTIRTWSFKFDPASLFASAAARKSGYTALKSYLDAFGQQDALALRSNKCKGGTLGSCADELMRASGAGVARALGILLPTFEVKSLDEFDFRQVGGRFIVPLASQKEATLETYSFTWDLKRIFSGFAAERGAALSAAKVHIDVEKAQADLVKPGPALDSQKLPPPIPGASYVARLSASGTGALKWEMSPENGFPGVKLHADGWLTGFAETCTRADCSFTVKVSDPRGKFAECRVQLPGK